MRRTALLLLPLLAACGQLEDNRFSTGSSTLVASEDYSSLHALEADSGVLATIEVETRDRSELELGGEPTRIARAGGLLFVSQRTERAVAVVSEDGLELNETIEVGAEPVGVVASEDGDRVWVASSLSGRVDEIDVETLSVTRSFDVADEPKWLALHPSDKALFVGSAVNGRLSRIDLEDGDVLRIELPDVSATPFDGGAAFSMTPRITGDLSIRFDGKSLAVPVLYVDNTTAVPDPNTDEAEGEFDDFGGSSDGYAANGGGRFTGTVVTLPLDGGGVITDAEPEVLSLNGFVESDDFRSVGGYAASVTFTPDGTRVLATMEGSSAVLAVQSMQRQVNFDGPGVDVAVPMPMIDEGFGGGSGAFIESDALTRHATDTIVTDAGPRGVAFLAEDDGFVHSFLDRTIANLRVDALPVRNEAGDQAPNTILRLSALSAGSGVEVAASVLPADVEAGRRLFYAADDSRMSADGAAVSCATCHHDGRADGVTWTFTDGVRQTPSLAGVVSLTAPVTWTNDVLTVHDEVVTTSQGRMGGEGLNNTDAAMVAAFVDWSREPDVVRAGELSDSVVRGKALFESEEVGCADCHSGIAYTDNEPYELYDLESVRTRGLVGISTSAPYLHDGSAGTLRALMERSRDGSMGDTSALNDAQMDDLVAYLESL